MANTNDSFIDEVSEAVRRDRLARWMRRWGWVVALVLVAVVGGAAWWEWRKANDAALAQLRGDTLLAALEIPDDGARLAALAEVADEGVVAALLLAAEQQRQGDPAAAAATYREVAGAAATPPLYRDLASLKALTIEGAGADRGALEALAAPGAPFRFLALEQLALVEIEAGEIEAGAERLRAILSDAETTASLRSRADAMLKALGLPAEAGEAAPAAPAAP